MRCRACDNPLSDQEVTRKYATMDEYVELCTPCLQGTGIAYTDNPMNVEKASEEELELPDPFDEVLGG